MKVEGICHCGAIHFEAEVNPDNVVICHCTDCQQFSGAPYRVGVPAKAEDVTFTKGMAKTYVKIADSGNRRAQGFCGDCGTSLFSTQAEGPPQFYMFRIGALKQRDQLPPKRQIWSKSAQPWAAHIGEIESFTGQELKK